MPPDRLPTDVGGAPPHRRAARRVGRWSDPATPWADAMRAVRITRFGGPEVLDVVDLPDPSRGLASSATRCRPQESTLPTPTTSCPERHIDVGGQGRWYKRAGWNRLTAG